MFADNWLRKHWSESYRSWRDKNNAFREYYRHQMTRCAANMVEAKYPEWGNRHKVWEIDHSVVEDARRVIANANLATLRLASGSVASKTIQKAIESRIRRLEKIQHE